MRQRPNLVLRRKVIFFICWSSVAKEASFKIFPPKLRDRPIESPSSRNVVLNRSRLTYACCPPDFMGRRATTKSNCLSLSLPIKNLCSDIGTYMGHDLHCWGVPSRGMFAMTFLFGMSCCHDLFGQKSRHCRGSMEIRPILSSVDLRKSHDCCML